MKARFSSRDFVFRPTTLSAAFSEADLAAKPITFVREPAVATDRGHVHLPTGTPGAFGKVHIDA